MDKNTYTLVDRFECWGKTLETVIIEGNADCVMTEMEKINK